jgi:hypothetical protein
LDQLLHKVSVVPATDWPRSQRFRRLAKHSLITALATASFLGFSVSPASAQGTVPAPSEITPAVPSQDPSVQSAPPVNTPPAAPVVVQKSDSDKDTVTRQLEDGGLGLEWLYLNADLGVAYTNLISLRSSNWQIIDNSATGPAFGIGAGVRLVFFSAGVRVRDLEMSSFNMWETDLEAALHFRIWRIDCAIGARGGYAFLGQFSSDALSTAMSTSASSVTAHGWNVGPTVDLDFYLSKLISIGVDANAEFLFLERPPLSPQGETMNPALAPLYEQSGSSVGAGFLAMSHVGVHF